MVALGNTHAEGTAPKPSRAGGGLTRIASLLVASLDELAGQHYAGSILLSRRPSTPSFWFANLAIDSHVLGSLTLLRALSDESRSLLGELDLGGRYADEISHRNRWCTCEDDSFRGATSTCDACAEGHHERCPKECGWDGEIHLPEHVMSTKAA